ncbi:MAG: ribosome silencing factor [Elusimicrobia bacterium GWA2_61_42]|nr:MAG: ribosome silencing factor [Elusimicrobia bacterium GWA2_61_42]OGR77324.1 MAG: ribosome silencing factor [Elusimicrobia bacterium GWC2_61_25]
MTINKNAFKNIAIMAAKAGDSKKAEPVVIYDLAGKSPLADYAVLMAVESGPQLDAVEEEVQVQLKHEGVYCLHRDGMRSKNWKVLDYGGVLVHIYDTKAEEFYSITKVYADYKPVQWEEKPEPRAAAAAPARAAAPKAPAAAKPAKAAKKPAVKKAAVKKTAVKKVKPAARKAKPAAKKAKPAKKAPVKKAPAKKKITAKARPVKKAAAKKARPAAVKTSKKNARKK